MTPRTKSLSCLSIALLTTCSTLLGANNEWGANSGDWMTGPWALGTPPTAADQATFSINASSPDPSITINIADNENAVAAYLAIARGKTVNFTLGTDASLIATAGTWQIGSNGGTAPASAPGSLKFTGPVTGSAHIAVGAGGVNIGASATQIGNALELSGNLNFEAAGGVVVGRYGNSNQLLINNGARLTGSTLWVSATQNVTNGIGDNNSVLITGVGTEVNLSPTSNLALLVAARPTTGLATQQTGNHIRIEDGAAVRVEGVSGGVTADLKIGDTSYRVGNYVSVSGSGSVLELKNNTRILIGASSASSYNNYLHIADGGLVRNDGTTSILNGRATGGKNRIVIGNGGTLLVGGDITNSGGLLQLADGAVLRGELSTGAPLPVNLIVQGQGTSIGRFEAAGAGLASNVSTTIRSGGVMSVGLGSATTASTFTLNSSVDIEAGGILELRIHDDGAIDSIDLTSNGSLNIASGAALNLILGGYTVQAGDTWTIFTGETGNIAGELDMTISTLPALSGGLEWDYSRLSEAGGWQLTAIPEPSSVVLLLAGVTFGIGAYHRTRRKANSN